jgi:hypothetical protein
MFTIKLCNNNTDGRYHEVGKVSSWAFGGRLLLLWPDEKRYCEHGIVDCVCVQYCDHQEINVNIGSGFVLRVVETKG